MFSLSFRSFPSLCLANKEKEKDISKTFLFQMILLLFLLYCDKRRKSKQKEEKRTVFYALTSVAQMDIAGVSALLRSLKNAHGASVVYFKF